MLVLKRGAPALAAALALVACAPLPPSLAAAQSPVAVSPVAVQGASPAAWPQDRSDVTADADVLFGVLDNGMRYAIRRQTVPPGQA
ncbi:MAG TPA: hypothetical protein PKA17_10585, partial [Phenylobacterium sp.]|nr:hypothetical protein [Phenylobacterium sp.]